MNSIWQSLIWKEWHEHKWKLAAMVAMLLVPGSVMAWSTHYEPEMLAVSLTFCILPLAIFFGLGEGTSERSQRTLPFLQSLPVPLWQAAVCKIVFGALCILVPILVSLVVLWLWVSVRHAMGIESERIIDAFADQYRARLVASPTVDMALLSVFGGLSIFAWSAALGVNHKDEVSAAAVAIPAVLGWWALMVFIWTTVLQNPEPPLLARALAIGLGASPGGVVSMSGNGWPPGARWIGYLSFFVSHGALVAWYIKRFGRIASGGYSPRASADRAGVWSGLAAPWRSRSGAIAWKQLRESGPLVLLGVAFILGCSLILFLLDDSRQDPWELYLEFLGGMTIVFGFIIAIVVGIGMCLYEISPGINTFWRSRPIQPDVWFWTKFVTGAVLVMAALFPPVAIAYALLPNGSDFFRDEPFYLPAAHLTTFAAAVAMTCLVRHAVYAAILTIPAVYAGLYLVFAGLKVSAQFGWFHPATDGWGEFTQSAIAAGFVVSFLLNTILAWLAFRNDWGVKGRY